MNKATKGKVFIFYEMELGGYFYGGKHEPKRGEYFVGMTGVGPIPSKSGGYSGSGLKKWRNILNKHGRENIRWKIVAILIDSTEEEIHAVECSVIAPLREKYGRRCANVREGYVMTSADQARFRADPAWWEAHRKGTQKKKENPAWREAQRLANQKMTSTPEWRAANRKANQKLAADPAWRAANRKAMQIVASTPEWRAAKFQATNSHYEPRLVKPIPAEALAELIAYLQATKGAGLPLVRALLRFSDAPKWQIKNAMVEAGLCSPSNELQGHTALHYLRPQLPIAPAKDQSPEAFVARLRELCAIGAKRSYAAFIAGLEFPSITGGEANRIAIAAGYEHRNLGTEINIARAIARLVAEYEAERVLATAAE